MKRQIGKNLRHVAATACAAILAMCSFQTAFAEDNIGLGDINGDSTALADSNVFQLSSTGDGLELVKTAWMTSDGSPIVNNSTVPQGTYVDFMIFVNNKGSVAINDISIQDVLDSLFLYQADSIRVDNSVGDCALAVCDTTEEAAIYAAASAVLPTNSDGVDGDTSSYDGPTTTVNAGDENVLNGTLNAAADSVLAVVFTVQVQ
jgi:uncharacterized repeat protein (TIGR01451 family)